MSGRSATVMQTPMEKALGRPSGAYRGLATRSVNMSYGSSGSAIFSGAAGAAGASGTGSASFEGLGFGSALPPHVPEGREASMTRGGLGVGSEPGYDAAAAAVDMVALARNSSGRKSGSFSGPAAEGGGAAAGGLARPSSGRSLASRSVGMAGKRWKLRGSSWACYCIDFVQWSEELLLSDRHAAARVVVCSSCVILRWG
jgi:hypothetical protein